MSATLLNEYGMVWYDNISGKGRRSIAVRSMPHRYGNSRASCDRTVLPEYSKLNENYFGLPASENIVFDTELVSKVIAI